MSLRLRLLLTLAPLFIAGLLAVDAGTFVALQSFLLSRVDQQLIAGHNGIQSALLGRGSGDGSRGQLTAFPAGTFGEIRDSSGEVLVQGTVGFGPVDPSTHPIIPSGVRPGAPSAPTMITVGGAGSVGRYRAYVDTADDGNRGDVLIVAVPLDDVDGTLARLLTLEATVTGAVTLVVIVAIWLIVRRGLRPLERMGAAARSIAASDLSQRISPATERTEVGRLGLALNAMLSQLDAAFAERAAGEARLRRFVSDASHELRTPLTSMRGYAELLRRRPHMDRDDVMTAIRRIDDETRRMGVLVDDLLLLARLDQGRPLQPQRLDLAVLVADAVADARVSDPQRTVDVAVSRSVHVEADEMRLRQALANLLRNALVHTPAESPVEVTLGIADNGAMIEVIDHGPGIPLEQAERIFERFHRVDPTRSRDQGGSGLGLSITAAIVKAHGGDISLVATPGGGATFRVRLPLLDGRALS